jgi:RNA polymerase sigma factor (sigma-70 family)
MKTSTTTGGTDPYFQEIANHELLSAAEELALAQQVRRGQAAQTELDEDQATDPDWRATLEDQVAAGRRAQQRLVECNLRLVVSVARRYTGRGLSLLDLVQEGNIGLQIGVEKYDWQRGCRLSTYVYWWITQSIRRAVAEQGRPIRLPGHVVNLLAEANRVERDLCAALGRYVSLEELAEALGVEPRRLAEARQAGWTPMLLGAPAAGDEDDWTLADHLVDENATEAAPRGAEQADLAERVARILDGLPAAERQVLRLRFGLDGQGERTLDEVGRALGVSADRARQVQAAALARLRQTPALRRELGDYLSDVHAPPGGYPLARFSDYARPRSQPAAPPEPWSLPLAS